MYDSMNCSLTLEQIEAALRALGRRYTRRGHRIRAQCPCHHDVNPSLLIEQRGREVLVTCFAGCPREVVISALCGSAVGVSSALVRRRYGHDVQWVQRGLEILLQAWRRLDTQRQPMAHAELCARGIRGEYGIVDATHLQNALREVATTQELISCNLAYRSKQGKTVMSAVLKENRVVIPYFRGERLVSLRSRRVGEDDGTPKYLSLKGYPAMAYIARANAGTPLIVVEGEFKAIVLAEHLPEDISVLGIPGVYAAWRDLNALCNTYVFTRRYVLFDHEPNNSQIARAAGRLARRIDADVLRIPEMSGDVRIAPDEFVLEYGVHPILNAMS